VNGKTRAELSVGVEDSQESVLSQAKQVDKVATFLDGKTVVKVIYVPKKILNIVVK
jgi:leucyl-tRNA synthetase